MNQARTVFSQLMEVVSREEFHRCVQRYAKEQQPRKFSYRDQFLAMAYAQVTFKESLRDIEICLSALAKKTYHMGFRSRVTRSTLAYANENRDWRIWHDFAQTLIARARKLYAGDVLEVQFKGVAYAIDSTTITLCLSLFPWAKYRTDTRAIKLHTQMDLRGNIPSFILISPANTNDVNFLDHILIEPGAVYIMDRGYFDFSRFFRFTTEGAWFVTRLKTKISYRRVKIFYRSRSGAVRLDATIVPLSKSAKNNYPQQLRLIEYFDSETMRVLVFITNNFALSAQTIADLYRSRWKVELFFKWIKQHLRIKAFFGTSQNAVFSQIWIAICVYVLAAILKKELQLQHSLHTILQVLCSCSAEKMPILSAFRDVRDEIISAPMPNQLSLFDIPVGH